MKPTIPVTNRPGRSKWGIWIAIAAGVFLLMQAIPDFNKYQEKAKAGQAAAKSK